MKTEIVRFSEALAPIYETRISQYEMERLVNSGQVNIYMERSVACFW
jgi:hypothetical protein